MVAVPIPDIYTVRQDYQPRRPGTFSAGDHEADSSASSPAQDGPIPFATGTKPDSASTSGPISGPSSENWNQYLAAGAFLAAGALLATGHRRLGIATAAAGVAAVLLEDRETVMGICKQLPTFLQDAQSLADQMDMLFRDSLAAISPLRR